MTVRVTKPKVKKPPPRKPAPKSRKPPPKRPPKPTPTQLAVKDLYPGEKVPYKALSGATMAHGGWLTGGAWVHMQAWGLQLSLTALLGADGGQITQSGGAWDEVAIPRGDPFTQWKGRQLYAMNLHLIFDGWGVRPHSVEPGLKTLETLTNRIPGTLAPTNVRMWGAIPKAGLSWVITKVTYDSCIRDPTTGERLRQEVHVELLEYRTERAVASLPRAAATPKPPQKYKVKKGDDLKKIAARLLGKSSRWPQIVKVNKGLRGFTIPKSFIGKTIKVPPR